MTDTPGWASPGSSGSDQRDHSDSPTPPPATPQAAAPPNWSKHQPPPGQWSVPSGGGRGGTPPPPPPPGQGWGGAPGGWQPAPWGRPPAAKPGVIPLRPLGVGEILDGAVSTMRAHWRTVLGVTLVVALATQTASIVIQGLLLSHSTSVNALNQNPNPNFNDVMDALGGTLAGSGLAVLITMLGMIIATAMLTMVISRAVLGRPVTTADAWRDARPQMPRLLGLTLLLLLIGVAILSVGIAPGIVVALSASTGAGIALSLLGGTAAIIVTLWLMIRWSLASPALMLEKQGVLTAMGRSAKLVRGSWWRVLGIQLLAALLVYIVSSIIQTPFTFLAMYLGGNGFSSFMTGGAGSIGWPFLIVTGIGGVIGATITFPISAGVTALLYVDQRIRREALDLELARAAGVPGYGDTGPSDSTTSGS